MTGIWINCPCRRLLLTGACCRVGNGRRIVLSVAGLTPGLVIVCPSCDCTTFGFGNFRLVLVQSLAGLTIKYMDFFRVNGQPDLVIFTRKAMDAGKAGGKDILVSGEFSVKQGVGAQWFA